MAESAVVTENLSKHFGAVKALDDISFKIGKGELFGFIGPDGAGKTTLFRILTTLLLPDGGKATVEGFDTVSEYRQIRRISGYMPGKFSLYHDLSVEENLRFFATIFGTTVSENIHLVQDLYSQIEPFRKRKAGKLSGGMKQKLALCCALIHQPVILFLDEPTTGVDAVSRKEFWEMLNRLRRQQITILVSTPYMDEAGRCDRVALMQSGKIMTIDTPQGIRQQFRKKILAVKGRDMFGLMKILEGFPEIERSYLFGQSLHVTGVSEALTADDLSARLRQQQAPDFRVEEITPDIEDCFIDLTATRE
ncbi:MAG: ABC transporter ATP-binding protein [Bacteroidetes bacterium]|nr:ABC transporter ATP-binding protein [Bacteroidota bacterium]